MAAPLDNVSTASSNLTELLSTVYDTSSPQASEVALTTHQSVSDTWLGLVGHGLFVMAKAVPGTLVWLITFTTITLPTILFSLFSTSLTFTMNATTLSDHSKSLDSQIAANTMQDAYLPGLRFPRIMDRKIPLPQHVCSTTSRTATQRAPDRPLPRYPGRRFKAGAVELPGRIFERYQGFWVS